MEEEEVLLPLWVDEEKEEEEEKEGWKEKAVPRNKTTPTGFPYPIQSYQTLLSFKGKALDSQFQLY